ncbi:MAG: CD0415/CD1112 family protein [Angelakisella sp.]
MDMIFGKLEEMVKNWLLDIIRSNITDMLNSVNSQTANLGDLVTAKPSQWQPGIWAMVQEISSKAIVPIAAVILTGVMCYELIGWINEQNRFHAPTDVIAQLFKFIIKLFIGVTLVMQAQKITIGIFDLAAYAIAQSMGVVVTDPGSVNTSIETLMEALKTEEIGALMSMVFTSMFGNLGIGIIDLAVRLTVTARMIEIYIYCSIGSLPYATLGNSELKPVGVNYIKNLFALAFQGFFMFIMLGIYAVLMRQTVGDAAGGEGAAGLIFNMLFTSGLLVLMLIRSKAIAKSIFSAQ